MPFGPDDDWPEPRLASGGWRLPMVRVMADVDGRLTFLGPAPLGPGEVNEDWWADVLEDPRARWRRMRGSHDTISRYPDMMFTAYCEKCRLNQTVPTNDLIDRYGSDTPVNIVAIELAGQCHTRPKWCKLRKFIRLPSGDQIER